MYGIGIDVGSTNVKVALVDSGGALHAAASRPLYTEIDGDIATQDIEALWAAVLDALGEVGAARPARSEVVSIGVCSQYSSTVGVDAAGAPTTPLVMYLDQRGSDHCWAILERHPVAFDEWISRHGIPPVGGGLSLAHLLHLQLDAPETHAATSDYLEVMDFVNLRLTGRAVATQATMFTSQLCDNRTLGTTEYDGDLIAMSGVDEDRLPELIAPDGVVGNLSGDVAEQLGLSRDVVVLAGMNDTQAAALATDAFTEGRTGLMIGTTAVLLDTVDRVVTDLEREVVSMPATVADRYLVMAENGSVGRSVEHTLCELLATPNGDGVDPFAEIGPAMEATSAGAGGVLFLPWLAGSLSPSSDSSMRGGYLGVTLSTTRADLLRATLEGTARNLRWLLPAVHALSGHGTSEIVFGGGAARSPAWAQCVADVLGHPVAVLEQPELAVARSVGLVALQRHVGGEPSGCALEVGSRFEPDPSAASVHDRLQGPFEETFAAVQGICHSLSP